MKASAGIFAGAAGWLSLSLIVAGFVERVVMALQPAVVPN